MATIFPCQCSFATNDDVLFRHEVDHDQSVSFLRKEAELSPAIAQMNVKQH